MRANQTKLIAQVKHVTIAVSLFVILAAPLNADSKNAQPGEEQVNAFQINDGVNDAWYNPETSGQGFFINVFSQGGTVFLAWFTYETERPPDDISAVLGDPGHRWLTAFGSYSGDQAELDIEVTRGGIFNSGEPKPTQVLDGRITLQFMDCESGTVAFDIPSINQSGVVPIRRLADDNVALCEELNQ